MSILNDETLDDNKDYFSELVGEGKKYKDTNELAKAYFHADRTIGIFKPRMDELRDENTRLQKESLDRAKLEELIQKIETLPQPTSSTNPANEDTKPAIDLNELDKRWEANFNRREAEKKQLENASMVQAKLKERFGNNYSNIVREQIAELGWSEEDFNTQARLSPKATLRALGVDQTPTESFQAPVRGQSTFGRSAEPKKTWSYYQNLKKTNPNLYRDPKTTNEMIEMAEKYGNDFYDGDFNRY